MFDFSNDTIDSDEHCDGGERRGRSLFGRLYEMGREVS